MSSLFFEDVVAWLDNNEVRYVEQVKFTGKSGHDHLFDFVIPKSKKQPERIIQAINRPGRDEVEAVAFAWFDTKDVRPLESRAYAVLNDAERGVLPPVLDALHSYEVIPVSWSGRDAILAELTGYNIFIHRKVSRPEYP